MVLGGESQLLYLAGYPSNDMPGQGGTSVAGPT